MCLILIVFDFIKVLYLCTTDIMILILKANDILFRIDNFYIPNIYLSLGSLLVLRRLNNNNRYVPLSPPLLPWKGLLQESQNSNLRPVGTFFRLLVILNS